MIIFGIISFFVAAILYVRDGNVAIGMICLMLLAIYAVFYFREGWI